MAKDYYKELGVERDASQDAIKKAFRKLALEHHPDRAEDKQAAEARFKEINEAYAVLSDPEKRKQYDMFGADRFHQQFSQDDIFRGANFASIQDILSDLGFGGDVFSRVFGGFSGGRPAGGAAGGFDPFGGAFGGSGFAGGGFGGHTAPTKGHDAEAEITITFEEAVLGAERQISLTQGQGSPGRSLKVKIPVGSSDGTKLRLKGQGGAAPPGGQRGDLYLLIRVAPHSVFRRRGERDIEADVRVNVLDLILGGSMTVPTLQGETKRIKIKAGTQPETAVRLKGFGLPDSRSQPAGDLYAIVRAAVPESLTDDQKRLFEQLRESGL